MNNTHPRYYEIAVDVAGKIADGTYKVGDRVYARTALATQYGTSPETARRAMNILAELEIVSTTKGSGVKILSVEKADAFLKRQKSSVTLQQMKEEMQQEIAAQSRALKELSKQMDEFAERAQHFRPASPLAPYMITVSAASPQLGRTISQMRFWQNTGATVVAVRQNERMVVSPGPHFALSENDILYYIGLPECVERVHHLLAND